MPNHLGQLITRQYLLLLLLEAPAASRWNGRVDFYLILRFVHFWQ